MTNREAIREAIREYADDLPFGVEHRRRVDELDLWLSPILASAIRELRTEYTLALDAWLEQLTARGARTRENRCKTTTLTLPGPIENRCGTTGFITTADAKTVAAQRLSTDGHAFLKSWGGDPSGVSCAPPSPDGAVVSRGARNPLRRNGFRPVGARWIPCAATVSGVDRCLGRRVGRRTCAGGVSSRSVVGRAGGSSGRRSVTSSRSGVRSIGRRRRRSCCPTRSGSWTWSGRSSSGAGRRGRSRV